MHCTCYEITVKFNTTWKSFANLWLGFFFFSEQLQCNSRPLTSVSYFLSLEEWQKWFFHVTYSFTSHSTDTGGSFHKPAICPVGSVSGAVMENERTSFDQSDSRIYKKQRRGVMKRNVMPGILLLIVTLVTILRQVAVPQKDTTYWCQMYKFPVVKKKHHVIKVSVFDF